jgi:dihydrofolate reductase
MGDEPPFQAPVFVVTHREREVLHRQGGTSFTYVTEGVGRAIELARSAAGDKDVAIAGGGSLLGQVLAAGLLDELDLHIVPVILGDGMRLFDPARLALPDFVGIELTPTRIVDTPGVTHVRYAVDGRASLAANAAA